MEKKYQPISCNFYDELEALAVQKKACNIQFYDVGGQIQEIEDTIITFKIIAKAEYMILKENAAIRLDRLRSVDGKVLKGYC